MKIVEAKLGSKFRGGRRAQVTVLIGEGSSRRSVTRYPRLEEGGIWVGLNPDASAPERNKEAKSAVEDATSYLTRANAELEGVNKDRNAMAEQVRAAKEKVAAAEETLEAAKTNRVKVAEDFPLHVQFKF